jgi:beta-glucosidase
MFRFKSASKKKRTKSSIWTMKIAFFVLAIILIIGLVFLIRSLSPRRAVSILPPPPDNAPYRDPSLPNDKRIDDLIARMTLDEKIGQMVLVEKNSIKNTADIAAYGIGAVLSGAGAKPNNNTVEGWAQMVAQFSRI